jgi:hypothetical protein
MYLHPMIPVSERTPSQTFFLVLIIGLLTGNIWKVYNFPNVIRQCIFTP